MYWKILSKQGRYFTVGKEGYQVEVLIENGRQVIRKPWRRNKRLNDDLKLQMTKEKILAQAAVDRDDFLLLWKRIEDSDWPGILTGTLRGYYLAKYLKETPTTTEAANYLRNH